MLRPLASSSAAKSAKVVILGAFVHVTLKSSESKLHVYILFPMFFGWMRTNGGRNVCLFNTVKIKVCSPVITTDWDGPPSQATVTQWYQAAVVTDWLNNFDRHSQLFKLLLSLKLKFQAYKISFHPPNTYNYGLPRNSVGRDSTDQSDYHLCRS